MKFQISHILLLTLSVALAVGWLVDRSGRPQGVPISVDPIHSAIENRLGRPDEVTGSGRSFLHYDFDNGGRFTIIVSGGQIIGSKYQPKNE